MNTTAKSRAPFSRAIAHWLVLADEIRAHIDVLSANHHRLMFAGPYTPELAAMLAGCEALEVRLTAHVEYLQEDGGLLFYGSPTALQEARILKGAKL